VTSEGHSVVFESNIHNCIIHKTRKFLETHRGLVFVTLNVCLRSFSVSLALKNYNEDKLF